MSQNQELPLNSEINPSVTTCANCKAPMPLGLRFCRNCGYRLGEGSAEYTETARFENGRPTVTPEPGTTGPQSYATTYGLGGGPMIPGAGPIAAKRKKKISGMTWMFLGLLIFFVAAAAFTAIVSPMRQGRPPIVVNIGPRAYFGINSFEDADGGVTFDNVDPPGGPADKAELVGGDVITSVDGKPITSEDEITALLREQSYIGKTVDVVYIRDGETKTTKITPVSKDEFDRLVRQFRERPERKGRFGFDDDRTERVPIEGTKMFGVRLDEIQANYPADMAGIKEGDVVITFDKIPIRTPEELTSRVRRAIPYSTVEVEVMRGTERVVIPVKMGSQ